MREPNSPAQNKGSVLCLMGTSRPDGDTRILVDAVLEHIQAVRLIDVGALSIAPYDYQHRHETDDFSIVADAIDEAQVIIFATPVYWYTMSAQLKIVFDRLSDLTETRKAVGKRLAGKTLFAIVNGEELPDGFLLPFSETAGYFDMQWGGSFVAPVTQRQFEKNGDQDGIAAFAANVTRAAAKSP